MIIQDIAISINSNHRRIKTGIPRISTKININQHTQTHKQHIRIEIFQDLLPKMTELVPQDTDKDSRFGCWFSLWVNNWKHLI